MGNILTKINEAETELKNLELEIEKKKNLLNEFAETMIKKHKSEDLLCIESCETYDMLDWFFVANGGERIVNTNNTFHRALIAGMNSIYDRGYQTAVNDLTKLK